jgi:hypothetical protein
MKTLKFEVEVSFINESSPFTKAQVFTIARNIERAIKREVDDEGIAPDDSDAFTKSESIYATPHAETLNDAKE